ncbi:hypothetical protein Dsin_008058 [Dipteronia sinensis]|uniref:Growth-regulating factor n=1 Tax=Dipteronia sinensis TaxID=43782 RepID=A0AAE0B1V0_9ROSI|nr:hypothetical protein Dsin_008058 [Dipteronia sinensis]
MGTRSDFVGKKKGVCVGLGLRMQENQTSSGHKSLMVVSPDYYSNRHHDEYQLSSSSSSWDNTSGGGSMFCNTSNQVACMGDIYDVVGSASGSGSGSGTHSSLLMSKSLHPDSSLFPFNSSVGDQMAAASVNLNMRVPFTAAQLQELKRQTVIFEYMMASVPVPHELILPITRTPSRVPHSQSNSSVELGLLSNNNNSDPEPWRCRRTDGKKWRCSRDVAPDQKYCERHSHKSRPRSRKPVEVQAHLNKNDQNLKNSLKLAPPKSQFVNQTLLSSMASTDEQQPRCLDWFMKGQTMPVVVSDSNSHQEWHQKHLINNSNSCINFGGDHQNFSFQAHQRLVQDQYGSLLGPKLVSHQAPTQETRHFIDAWSIAEEENRANERLPLSSLALSMSGGGSEIIERNEDALMGGGSLGIMGSGRENVGTLRPHWMNHDSGMASPPGGPLAEALCLGIASSAKLDSNAASSPRGGGCSTSTTTSSKSSCGDGCGRGFNFTD